MDRKQLSHHEFARTRQRFPLRLIADDVQRPANVGALFRIADAFGIERLYLSGRSVLPPHPKLAAAARHAERAVAWEHRESAAALVRELRAEGHLIVSLEITADSVDIRQLQLPTGIPVCLLVGSEQHGVRAGLLELSDHVVHIPMFGQNSSLNVAAACSIAVFELIRMSVR